MPSNQNKTNLNQMQNSLIQWEEIIKNMQFFAIPDDYFYHVPNQDNKYHRFTGYLKEWISRNLFENDEDFYYDEDDNTLENSWWETAQKIGDGKNIEDNRLPKINHDEYFIQNAEKAYNKILPAYRALKESFEHRSIFQWIFNHRQYTAERDALKAITGVITTLTGKSKEELDQKYNDFVKALPSSSTKLEVGEKNLTQEHQKEEKNFQDSIVNENEKDNVIKPIQVLEAEEETVLSQFSQINEEHVKNTSFNRNK